MKNSYDIAVLGGGPGGYVAAIRAAQLGKKVVLIEKENIGGTCMNWGCIPTKYLLQQTKHFKEFKENPNYSGPRNRITFDWKKIQREKNTVVDKLVKGVEFILKKNRVEVVKGMAFLKEENFVEIENNGKKSHFQARKIILSTGSLPAVLPFLKPNGREIVTSRGALELGEIPKRLVVVGAGAVGLELGTVFKRMGSEVMILEIMPSILPGWDEEMTKRMERILKSQGLQILTQMRIEDSFIEQGKVRLKGKCTQDQTPFEMEAEKVLVAAGRRPNVGNLFNKRIRLKTDSKGWIKVNSRMETSFPGIFAAGDLIGGKLLAHKAYHEGIVAAENASGLQSRTDYRSLPSSVFTDPELASVGLTESEAREKYGGVLIGRFSLQANGRALTMRKPEGTVKILANKKEKIVGAHLIAPNASEIIAEIALAIKRRMNLHDLAKTIHIHPTISEAVMEAALQARGEAIHALKL